MGRHWIVYLIIAGIEYVICCALLVLFLSNKLAEQSKSISLTLIFINPIVFFYWSLFDSSTMLRFLNNCNLDITIQMQNVLIIRRLLIKRKQLLHAINWWIRCHLCVLTERLIIFNVQFACLFILTIRFHYIFISLVKW